MPPRLLRSRASRHAFRRNWLSNPRVRASKAGGWYTSVATLRGERLQLVDPANAHATSCCHRMGLDYEGKPMPRLPSRRWRDRSPCPGSLPMACACRFLCLPPGIDAARAPMLVVVHGGPFSHARPEWNTQAQFLANRGYVVFWPNFRSSTGFGRHYLFAGNGDFGGSGRVQRDIVEGTRWLLAGGIGDAGRVGMVGASYGGYATLLALSFTPELFKVGTAAVPPADFGRVIREYSGSAEEMVPGVPIAVSMRDLGVDPADARLHERLRTQSPITWAASMRRPLLIFAGGEDDRVPIRGIIHYAALLHSLRKDVSLFVDADAGHGLADPRTREAWFYLQKNCCTEPWAEPIRNLRAPRCARTWIAISAWSGPRSDSRSGAATLRSAAATAPRIPRRAPPVAHASRFRPCGLFRERGSHRRGAPPTTCARR